MACIMDGNGRWATRQGLPRSAGHAAGVAAVLGCVDAALDLGLRWLTLFVFSTENWSRPSPEVEAIMRLNAEAIRRYGESLLRQGTRVRYMGMDDDRIPPELLRKIKDIERVTAANTRLTVTLAFNHGGRSELVDAVRRIVRAQVPPDDITEQLLGEFTQYPDMPDVDLLIRTSGEHRISNFMLWRMAYAELMFVDTLWPNFTGEHLVEAVRHYQQRCRRYGAVSDLLGEQQDHGKSQRDAQEERVEPVQQTTEAG
ncbi:polyprenyl diphosphate synthase [Micromonospora sediminimaris]|uniref:polyprenyl diphosphate synthase n=1 Tax=Micromonospora sediminimaris TaxID=547162 RepID=UPI00379ADF0E